MAYAAKSKMIIIGGGGGGINPRTLTLSKGDTAIWVNNSAGEISIFFPRGKEVEAVCAAPSRFAMDAEGKYGASIPQGGTASLCFVEAGKYTYTAVREKTAGGSMDSYIVVK